MSNRNPARRPWFYVLVVGLLALHYALAVGSKLNESTTSDELVHLTGGYTYNYAYYCTYNAHRTYNYAYYCTCCQGSIGRTFNTKCFGFTNSRF